MKASKTLHYTLWFSQMIISASFIWAAYTKLFTPPAELGNMWPWTKENPLLVQFTAIVDFAGGVSIVLFWLIRTTQKWTSWIAVAIILQMVSASVFHILRGEASVIGINIFMALLATFIAWGRWVKNS